MDVSTVILRILAILLIVLYYMTILSDMQKKRLATVYVSLFIIGGIAVLIAKYYQREKIGNELVQILAVASMGSNMEPRLSKTDSFEKLLLEIEDREQRILSLREDKSLLDKIFGRDEETDTLVAQTLTLLDSQKKRIAHLNCKSSYKYNTLKLQDASSELKLLGSDALDRDYLNSGFRINHSEIFVENNVVLVRIVEHDKDSVLYQQSYVPKDSINSFVLPNLFSSDKIELQMGYINKNDTSIYHYISVRPYGK